jgi:hypothetical protein
MFFIICTWCLYVFMSKHFDVLNHHCEAQFWRGLLDPNTRSKVPSEGVWERRVVDPLILSLAAMDDSHFKVDCGGLCCSELYPNN